MDEPNSTKCCSQCKRTWPATAEFFKPDSRYRSGFESRCRECRREHDRQRGDYFKEYRAKHKAQNSERVFDGAPRLCKGCGEKYPGTPEYFRRDNSKPDGLQSKCKACKAGQDSEWYAELKNDPGRKAQRSAYETAYRERNRERINLQVRERYYANHESELARLRQRRSENPERARTAWHRYYAKHKERARLLRRTHEACRRAQKAASEGSYTAEEVLQMLEDQDGLCAYCEMPLFGKWHVEHMRPLARGGSNDWRNIAIACPSCNFSKGSKTAEEYMMVLRE